MYKLTHRTKGTLTFVGLTKKGRLTQVSLPEKEIHLGIFFFYFTSTSAPAATSFSFAEFASSLVTPFYWFRSTFN